MSMDNKLIYEKSPYLLQHAHNPVNWYPWGEEAFAKAKRENKPIFLSIGYSTCHWCHVMEKESFEDEKTAKILNEHYIAIKVDREERLDIDTVYMAVCQEMTGHGGWPLTIIMTAEQRPFFAGTYFPKKSNGGRNSLDEILLEIAKDWEEEPDEIKRISDKVAAFMHESSRIRVNEGEPDKNILKKAAHIFEKNYDRQYGGFGTAPKFPMAHNLLFLMRYAQFEGKKEWGDMAYDTLLHMYRGGIFDHVGGGFSRYSTDDKWLMPHFEKMLYDNALLSYVYLEAYQITKRKIFREIAEKILQYVLTELTDGNGGFYCGQDADGGGEEGGHYTFLEEEIIEVLEEKEGKAFNQWFGLAGTSTIGKAVPNLLQNDAYEERNPYMEHLCHEILSYRKARISLHKDDKILTSWNGLMIAAFAKAYQVLGEECYRQAAKRAEAFVAEYLTEADGRLRIRFRDGEAAGMGILGDYAFMGFGFLELYNATFDVQYLEKLIRMVELVEKYFEDPENGGYYLYSSDGEKLLIRPKELYDGALPSGNGIMACLLVHLAHLTGETVWAERSNRQLRFLAQNIGDYPAGYSVSLLAMLGELYAYRDLVCTTSRLEDMEPLREKLRERWCGNLALLVKTEENEERVEKIAPFTREYLFQKNSVLYFLCQDGACMPPVDDVEKLELFCRE